MPNPYHDPANGRFTFKRAGGLKTPMVDAHKARIVKGSDQTGSSGGKPPSYNLQKQIERSQNLIANPVSGAGSRYGTDIDAERKRIKYNKGRLRDALYDEKINRERHPFALEKKSAPASSAVPPKPRVKRPGAGSGATDKYVAEVDDLGALRGVIGGSSGRKRESLDDSVRAIMKGRGGTLGAVADGLAEMGLGKSERAKQVRSGAAKPKGWTGNSMPIRIVDAGSLPTTGTPRGRGRSK